MKSFNHLFEKLINHDNIFKAIVCASRGKRNRHDVHTNNVRIDDVITQAEADKLLDIDIAIKEKEVNSVLKVPVTQGQYDALVSFTFNLGIGNLKKSTLLRLVNQGKYKNASKEFSRWVYAGGKVLTGLVKRRNEEKELFLS